MALSPRRSRRALLRRRSWQAAHRLRVEPAVRRREHRRSSPAMLRAAHAGCRCGVPFRRLSGVTSGYATGGAAAIGIRSPGAAAILPTCYRSTTCCRLPRVAARSRTTSRVLCPSPLAPRLRDRRRRRSRRGSATSTPDVRLAYSRALLRSYVYSPAARFRGAGMFRSTRFIAMALPGNSALAGADSTYRPLEVGVIPGISAQDGAANCITFGRNFNTYISTHIVRLSLSYRAVVYTRQFLAITPDFACMSAM